MVNQVAHKLNRRWPFLAALGIATLILLTFWAIQKGWFMARPPLELGGEPAWLFFNTAVDCKCGVMGVYQAADRQIAAWQANEGEHIPLQRIMIEERPDLARKYRVVRAPTLILLDAKGQQIWRQEDVVSDEAPLDLIEAQNQVEALQKEATR